LPATGQSAPSEFRSKTGQLAVLGAGNSVRLAAAARQESRSPKLDVLVLGGQPIHEPVAWAGPFVMNTREEVMQAFADYQAGRIGSIPARPRRTDGALGNGA
jgi:redox-sensitive bicupin YhaK (pirin superfamily)